MNESRREDSERIDRLRPLYPAHFWADTLKKQACVVIRAEQEIQFFANEKDAGSWIQHVYGVTPIEAKKDLGIYRKSIQDRGPKAGDMLIYLDDGEFYHHGIGCLDHSYGSDVLSVCFSASTFRIGDHISCSGGPVPRVDPADLIFDGLRRHRFWRWGNGNSGHEESGDYYINTPSWRWNGKNC